MNTICTHCGARRPHEARGLCRLCYEKARVLGMLAAFPKKGPMKAKTRAEYWRQRDATRKPYFDARYARRKELR